MSDSILKNTRQAKKLRAFIWAFEAFAFIALALAIGLYSIYGPALSIFFVVIGLTPLFGMLFYSSLYAVEIRGTRTYFEFDVLTLLGKKTKKLPIETLSISKQHRARIQSSRMQYNDEPWIFLYAGSRLLPFFCRLAC